MGGPDGQPVKGDEHPTMGRTHVSNRTCSHLPATVIIEAYSDGADEVSQAIIARRCVTITMIITQLRIRCTYGTAARVVREQYDATKQRDFRVSGS